MNIKYVKHIAGNINSCTVSLPSPKQLLQQGLVLITKVNYNGIYLLIIVTFKQAQESITIGAIM